MRLWWIWMWMLSASLAVAGCDPGPLRPADPFADAVVSFVPGAGAGFGQDRVPDSEPSRRRALLGIALLPACGIPSSSGDSEPIPLRLSDYPSLAAPGGSAVVSLPSALLELVVIRVAPEDYRALWRICSHGACTVEYDASDRQLVCPCHGSRFDLSGAVTLGPARSPLRRFEVRRSGDMLLVQRRA